jgi:beta-galactosidase
MAKYDDHQSSSYDLEHCDWSDLPEDNFILHEDLPYCIGEFVWTGFDYLGEPTPYYTDWPSHSSLFGIIDLAGIPKDRYYLYRSHWNEKESTLHILPHWNWAGKEGEVVPVMVYTSFPSAELFINGKSQGRKTKDLSFTVHNTGSKSSQDSLNRQKRYRLMWMDTRYEPGTVKVVAYDSKGNTAAEAEIQTAGKPDHLMLEADRKIILADGKDLSFIRVKVVDKNGNLCPEDSRQVNFKVKGPGSFKAAANGNPVSLESFQVPSMKLFNGQLTAIVQSSEVPGTIIFEASSDGVKPGTVTLTGQQP